MHIIIKNWTSWCLGVSVKVLVVDIETDQVLPPVTIRTERDWTVGELKKFLRSVSYVWINWSYFQYIQILGYVRMSQIQDFCNAFSRVTSPSYFVDLVSIPFQASCTRDMTNYSKWCLIKKSVGYTYHYVTEPVIINHVNTNYTKLQFH